MRACVVSLVLVWGFLHPVYSKGFRDCVDGTVIGCDSRQWKEKTVLSISSGEYEDNQNYWRNSLYIGVRIKPGLALTDSSELRVIPKVGLASVYYTGDGLLDIVVEGRVENRNRSPFDIAVGIQPGVHINFSRSYLHAWTLLIPFSASWRRIELQYTPGFTFPMGESRKDVFAGHTTHSSRFAFIPLSFGLTVRVGKMDIKRRRDRSREKGHE